MDNVLIAQPALDEGTLERFADATLDLLTDPAGADLGEHLQRLAALTQSDLVLLYEDRASGEPFSLVAAHGLPTLLRARFASLGVDESAGAGGVRRPASAGEYSVSDEALTEDLVALGIRGCWACAVRLQGRHLGTLFFGSQRWQSAHIHTTAIIAAASAQLAWVLAQRQKLLPAIPLAAGPQASTTDDRNHFIAVLAHELRNPVAPIRSGLDLLASGQVGDTERRDTLAMMQRQLAHLVRLMDDLLDTARLSTGRLSVQREPVRLQEVLTAAMESIQPALRARGQNLQAGNIDPSAVVLADPVRLSQAFVNILNSNVKRTPSKGTITINSTVGDEVVVLTFADQGAWLSDREAGNVFVLFPPDKSSDPDNGLTIGLALVRGLIELNGGSVEVVNREQTSGSLFTVTLPLTHQPAPAAENLPGPSDVDWVSHRVLIVDDNQDAAEILGLLFELDGKTVRMAHDGPAAVAEAADFQPEIILMDMGLPGFNGTEAIRQIRAAQAAVRPCIVALTGWGAQADRNASRDAGADLHLVKPIPYPELTAAIASLGGQAQAAVSPAIAPPSDRSPQRDDTA